MEKNLDSQTDDAPHPFIQLHQADVIGVLHGGDRLRLQGTLRSLYHPSVMEYYLKRAGILWKDFKSFAVGLTDRIRQAGAALAQKHNRPMIYLPSSRTNKERIASGCRPGLPCSCRFASTAESGWQLRWTLPE